MLYKLLESTISEHDSKNLIKFFVKTTPHLVEYKIFNTVRNANH